MKAYVATIVPDNALLQSIEEIRLVVLANSADEALAQIEASHFVDSGQHVHIDREIADRSWLNRSGLEPGIVRVYHP